MIDVREGDTLVVGANEYAVRAVAEWDGVPLSAAFQAKTTVTASTKRNPAISGGKAGDQVTHLALLKITPLFPVNPETAQTLAPLETPFELKECYAGDSTGFVHIIVEEQD